MESRIVSVHFSACTNSCHHQIVIDVIDSVWYCSDNNETVGSTYADLQKAFDTVSLLARHVQLY